MDLQLKGKTAVITGGSRGIGLAVAEGLAQEGVKLVLCARDQNQLEDAVGSIREKYKVDTDGVVADVSKSFDIDELTKRIKEIHDGIDILINNAGVGSNETIMEAPDERWQYYWDLHVMAAVRLSRASLS